MGSACFFFASRRRHTRYIGDWSSDVCSSDLGALPTRCNPFLDHPGVQQQGLHLVGKAPGLLWEIFVSWLPRRERSEERRVGKEYRSRRTPHAAKQTKQSSDRGLVQHVQTIHE